MFKKLFSHLFNCCFSFQFLFLYHFCLRFKSLNALLFSFTRNLVSNPFKSFSGIRGDFFQGRFWSFPLKITREFQNHGGALGKFSQGRFWSLLLKNIREFQRHLLQLLSTKLLPEFFYNQWCQSLNNYHVESDDV